MSLFPSKKAVTYRKSGVDIEEEEEAIKRVAEMFRETFSFRGEIGSPAIPIAHFAGVIRISAGMGLAVKTDGVGTKVFIAQLMHKYDTVGIDCVAMNVNDVVCVGAEPICFIDYLALQKPNSRMMEEIAKGLVEGARKANVSIAGGETAQLPEMIKGKRKNYGFDLAGMCIGLVPLDKIVTGEKLAEGDVIIGLKSSGIHSNGLTLARKILLEKSKLDVHSYIDELGRSLGEELLEPTLIYVQPILEILRSGLKVKVMANITGKGLLNLLRVGNGFGYVIDELPTSPPIFHLIQKLGKVTDEEMFRVYNMGIGFCLVVPEDQVDEALAIIDKYIFTGIPMGKAVKDPERRIVLKPKGLVGFKTFFMKA